jgi:beta-aspartyl-dipeptidase (metallo-type)
LVQVIAHHEISPNGEEDIRLLDEDLAIDHVFARGQHMVRQGDPIVFGAFSRG